MKQTTPIISGGMNALRLPAFFENLGHSNVILTAGGGSFGHKDGPKPGAISCRQGEEAWKAWKAGQYGNISLSDGVIEFAKTHEEIKGAFLTFQKDADQIYPGWKESCMVVLLGFIRCVACGLGLACCEIRLQRGEARLHWRVLRAGRVCRAQFTTGYAICPMNFKD